MVHAVGFSLRGLSSSSSAHESMRLNVFMGLIALGSCLPLSTARAQAPASDSIGFRAGQWGAEFSLGNGSLNTTGAGVLRFQSARRALVLDMSANVYSQSAGEGSSEDQSAIRVGLGTRWYRPVTRNVLQSLTLGVLVSRDSRELKRSDPLAVDTRYTSTQGGAFAELGGSWLVTPQLSLGAAWQGNVRYGRGTQRVVSVVSTLDEPGGRTNALSASVGTLVLRAGVYF